MTRLVRYRERVEKMERFVVLLSLVYVLCYVGALVCVVSLLGYAAFHIPEVIAGVWGWVDSVIDQVGALREGK